MKNNRGSILVTGGAGYVGTAVIHTLHTAGYAAVAIDHARENVCLPDTIPYFCMNYGDAPALSSLCKDFMITAVIHLAASIEVGASVADPALYYSNNCAQLIRFLDTVRQAGIPSIIAASSSAVYGIPQSDRMDETHQTVPLSPYGRSKLFLEWILQDYAYAYGIRAVALRYANIAGALPAHTIGERHNPETHLIPRALAALDKQEPLTVYGTDYPTPDGSCLRDFVHIADVAHANLCALNYLERSQQPHLLTCNIGSGQATSVHTLIQAINQCHSRSVPVIYGARRCGDPASIVLTIDRAEAKIGWIPQQSSIMTIVRDASAFYFNNKNNASL